MHSINTVYQTRPWSEHRKSGSVLLMFGVIKKENISRLFVSSLLPRFFERLVGQLVIRCSFSLVPHLKDGTVRFLSEKETGSIPNQQSF